MLLLFTCCVLVRVIVQPAVTSHTRPVWSTQGTCMLYHVTTWCDVFPYQPDPEDFCEEQWLMAKLIHLLKADVADQQYVVSILFSLCACVCDHASVCIGLHHVQF